MLMNYLKRLGFKVNDRVLTYDDLSGIIVEISSPDIRIEPISYLVKLDGGYGLKRYLESALVLKERPSDSPC